MRTESSYCYNSVAMSLPDAVEQQRLKILFEDAIRNAHAANQRAVQASLYIAKEKTQYVEKIALANAGTIALVVSFVGSHSGTLQPPWLLRSALVSLFLAMISAMYRNWTYPFYQYAIHARQDLTAKREKTAVWLTPRQFQRSLWKMAILLTLLS